MAFSEKPPPVFQGTTIVDADGRINQEFLNWLNRVLQYLERMRAAIP